MFLKAFLFFQLNISVPQAPPPFITNVCSNKIIERKTIIFNTFLIKFSHIKVKNILTVQKTAQ